METAITSPINISHFQQEEAGPLVEADPEEPDGDRDHVPALELHSVYRSEYYKISGNFLKNLFSKKNTN